MNVILSCCPPAVSNAATYPDLLAKINTLQALIYDRGSVSNTDITFITPNTGLILTTTSGRKARITLTEDEDLNLQLQITELF